MINFFESKSIKEKKNAVFQVNSVLCKIGYQILQSRNLHTLKNNSIYKEICGQKYVITPIQICEIEKILENEELEGHGLTWLQLRFQAQVDTSKVMI